MPISVLEVRVVQMSIKTDFLLDVLQVNEHKKLLILILMEFQIAEISVHEPLQA